MVKMMDWKHFRITFTICMRTNVEFEIEEGRSYAMLLVGIRWMYVASPSTHFATDLQEGACPFVASTFFRTFRLASLLFFGQ